MPIVFLGLRPVPPQVPSGRLADAEPDTVRLTTDPCVHSITAPGHTPRDGKNWTPEQAGQPFGPFVNKHHFAGWMVMALAVGPQGPLAELADLGGLPLPREHVVLRACGGAGWAPCR